MSERLTERERRDYDALPAGAQKAYRNLRETDIDHGRAMEFARDVAIADELVDGAEAYADKREGAEDDIVEAESKILDRLNVPLDESELGLTQKASDAVYAFAKLHTSKPDVAERVFGSPKITLDDITVGDSVRLSNGAVITVERLGDEPWIVARGTSEHRLVSDVIEIVRS